MAPTTTAGTATAANAATFVGPPVSQANFGVRLRESFKSVVTPQNVSLALGATQITSSLSQGRRAEELGKDRAQIDRLDAIKVRQQTEARAKLVAERGLRVKERQKAQFISGNVRTNVGTPLLVEAQTRADIAEEIGFSLDVGRTQQSRLLESAKIEERVGRARKRRSRFEAVGIGAGVGLSFLPRS